MDSANRSTARNTYPTPQRPNQLWFHNQLALAPCQTRRSCPTSNDTKESIPQDSVVSYYTDYLISNICVPKDYNRATLKSTSVYTSMSTRQHEASTLNRTNRILAHQMHTSTIETPSQRKKKKEHCLRLN